MNYKLVKGTELEINECYSVFSPSETQDVDIDILKFVKYRDEYACFSLPKGNPDNYDIDKQGFVVFNAEFSAFYEISKQTTEPFTVSPKQRLKIAKAAMKAMILKGEVKNPKQIAETSILYADALIKELETTKPE